MGSPRKQRKKFAKPSHPWQKDRILAEQEISKEYGLRRKYEIWKMNTILKNFTKQAKNLIATQNVQSEKERNQLLARLSSLGLIESNTGVGDVLSLSLKDVMERRLQTIVYRKNLARSLTQARQFIVHEHIKVGDKVINSPSYLVPISEESTIVFDTSSALSKPDHPERFIEAKKEVKEAKKETEEDSKEAKEEKPVKKKAVKKSKEAKEKKVPVEKKESKEVKKAPTEKEVKKEAKEPTKKKESKE
ncbi:30S ribosomal protein S4 [Candidatus Woesearchaeota archaeon]|nr:30S ribosomal protein S4 [Candidatus Woesearchaeota archaeon]